MGYITAISYRVESKKQDFLKVIDTHRGYNFREFSYDGKIYYTDCSRSYVEFQSVDDIDNEILWQSGF